MEIIDITRDWVNITSAASLVDDSSYRFQNVGGDQLFLVESATEPSRNDDGFKYYPGEPDKIESLKQAVGLSWWARADETKTRLAVNLAV